MEDRLRELETRIGLAEDLVDELNLTIYRQQQQIEGLQQQLRHLYRQLDDVSAAAPSPREDIPPHY